MTASDHSKAHKRCVHYRPEAQPLADLINRGSFHGNDLVMRMRCADSVARAEDAIAKVETAGLIKRGNYDPCREQLFFGIGGFPGDRLRGLAPEHRSTLAHHWITVTFKYLEASDIELLMRPTEARS